MRAVLFVAIAAALCLGAAASAQPPAGSVVTVRIGPALQRKAEDYGQRELGELAKDLHDQVAHAAARARGPRPVRIDLVIEDATPNRPTFDQLSRTPGLSLRSIGLGGARVSGLVTYADGAERPFRDQFYETDLWNEHGAATWSDADRAFDKVADAVYEGRYRDAYAGPGPSGDGHFGSPYNR
jgi:hypothetical protein